ncbi:hypothetical protein sos41_11590 [Alphaproteobacteria bacterium SO-S41]|nr:hypothetical protein sos41_11590 [Alphaproteobacteria bacterium SO-S41]
MTDHAFRSIEDVAGDVPYPAAFAPIAGTIGAACSIPLSDLVIDPRFQRAVTAAGAALIAQIAAGFDWTKFTPLIVAPIVGQLGDGGARFAIIDGQHRAAAAFLRDDVPTLPCWIVEADVQAQSRAFLAINGERTKMHPLAIWHARLAGGDAEAAELFALLAAAGVELARYPMGQGIRPSHVTMCGADVMLMHRLHGEPVARRVLTWLRAAGAIAGTSLLQRQLIRPLAMIAADATLGDKAAIAALAKVKASAMHYASAAAAKAAGRSPLEEMSRRLRQAIEREMRGGR